MINETVWTPAEQTLRDQGFILIRETQRWGQCPTFRHDDGRIRFMDRGEALTPAQMYERLREEWVPVALEDVLWWLDHAAAKFTQLEALEAQSHERRD